MALGGGRPARPMVAVAAASAAERGWLLQCLRGYEIISVENGAELSQVVLEEPTPDLVVADARMKPTSALHVLVSARAKGFSTPFVIVLDFKKHHIRGFVSEARGTVLEQRFIGAEALADLAGTLIARNRRTK